METISFVSKLLVDICFQTYKLSLETNGIRFNLEAQVVYKQDCLCLSPNQSAQQSIVDETVLIACDKG